MTTDLMYFMAEEDDRSIVKIGKAENVTRRRNELQTGNSSSLIVIFALIGGLPLEREFHNRFKPDKITSGGDEWYKVTIELLDFVREKMEEILMTSVRFSPTIEFGNGPSRLESVNVSSINYPTKPPVQIFEQSHPYSEAEVPEPKNRYERLRKKTT